MSLPSAPYTELQPYRLELPTGWQVGTVNAYLFTDPEPILVDTGNKSENSWPALQEGLAQHGLDVSDLSRVIITHAHIDHYGQAGRIVANSDADVWISDLGLPRLLASSEYQQQRYRFYRDTFLPSTGLSQETTEMVISGIQAMDRQSHPIPPERIRTFDPQGMLQMGGRPWQVLYTPGHMSSQTCFYDETNRLLISADMLLATTPTPVVESPPEGVAQRVPALPRFLESLDMIDALEINTVLPGHGRPFEDHQVVIARQRARIYQRKAECLEWIRAGYSITAELLDKMYAHQPPAFRVTGLWMLVGYLDLLLAEEAVSRESIDGVWHYQMKQQDHESLLNT